MRVNSMFRTTGLILASTVFMFNNANAAAQISNNSNSSSNISNTLLQQIVTNTGNMLQNFNNIPAAFEQMTKMAIEWLERDNTDHTANMQTDFAALGLKYNLNSIMQNSQPNAIQLAVDTLNQPRLPINVGQFNATGNGKPEILNILPWVNDVVYPTMLGYAPVTAGGVNTAPYSYVLNASGMNIKHLIPGQNWQGKSDDQAKYSTFFATITSIETFNGYILKKLAGEAPLSQQQQSLIKQASNSDWIAEIGSEKLGLVLRQLLLFSSQSYVLLAQMVQAQREILTATTMQNTLLILNNQPSEAVMVAKAQGISPTT